MRNAGRRPGRRGVLAGAGALAAAAWLAPAVARAAGRRGRGGERAAAGGLARATLPRPSGPFPVGTVSVRLVDRSRPDPWVPEVPYRELMVSLRYPAREVAGLRRAPQLTAGEAAAFDQLNNFAGLLPAGAVDWAGTRTFAYEDAPLDRRHGPRPVVLYSPGVLDPRSFGTTLTDELASRGHVVVTVDHTYEVSAVEFPGGRVLTSVLPAEAEAAAEAGTLTELLRKTAAVRVADTRFVLDQLTALPAGGGQLPWRFRHAVDTGAIGMFGQSAGGFTALQAMHDDPRLTAAADLDGVLAYVQEDTEPGGLSPVAVDGLEGPVLLMGMEGHDHHSVPSWGALWEHSTGPRADLTLSGSRHATFTDAAWMLPSLAPRLGLPAEAVAETIGTIPAGRAVAAQRAYVAGFFASRLLGRGDESLWEGPSPLFPEIRFVS
ncbi:hydrolase [Streptomyces hoynatensis]|uniref:hydrolase n=1 Tax=Streptomyces hoynatensis TaxID=1141874 RepID=UPI001F4D4FE6|nr:hydrolase [Streptomyces hoynatensis]